MLISDCAPIVHTFLLQAYGLRNASLTARACLEAKVTLEIAVQAESEAAKTLTMAGRAYPGPAFEPASAPQGVLC